MEKIKKQFIIYFLLCVLLFSGCKETPPLVSDELSVAEEPVQEELPLVQQLAFEKVKELGMLEMEPLEAVRTSYEYLVSHLYFADPVGLDMWRYMTDDPTPIPYLENRSLSPLLFDIGSCEDFAAVQVLLLRAAGLEAEYVAGYTLSVDQEFIDHAWAIVKLEDEWYHLDPQLEQNIIRDGNLRYRFFLKSDETMLQDHLWGEHLINYWNDEMMNRERQQIREQYTPPDCPNEMEQLEPTSVMLPNIPNQLELDEQIAKIKEASGKEGTLEPIPLHVEPPILVAKYHITPPLLPPYLEETTLRYGKSFLEGEPLYLYEKLVETLKVPKETTVAVGKNITRQQGIEVAEYVLGDYPEFYWADLTWVQTSNGTGIDVVFQEGLTTRIIQERQQAIENRVMPMIERSVELSPFERALSFHDTIAKVWYDYEGERGDGGNIYGAFIHQLAYCDGYAKGYQYLLNRGGIPNIFLRGVSQRGITHAWNAIELDGHWYYVDTTWDHAKQVYFADGYHSYFAVSLEEISRERQWDTAQYPHIPESTSQEMDYFIQKGYAIDASKESLNDAVSIYADIFLAQAQTQYINPNEMQAIFLEVKIIGTEEDYIAWKNSFVKHTFEILRSMEQKAIEREIAIKVSFDTSVICNFKDEMQNIHFYPKVQRRA